MIGIVRSIDTLGRITLPMELRRTLNIDENTPLEISVNKNTIIIKKYDENQTIEDALIDIRSRIFKKYNQSEKEKMLLQIDTMLKTLRGVK